jgi:hypothetical protein
MNTISKQKILKLENNIQILENQMNLNPTEFIQASLNQEKGKLENRRQDIVEGLLLNTISCNIVPVQIEFLIVLKYDYLFH